MLRILQLSPILPVLVIEHAEDAVPLAEAIARGGIHTLEITLRTAAALKAIENVAKNVPSMLVGAGTITRPQQFAEITAAGAKFAVSPGLMPSLIAEARLIQMPYLPGIATVSEALEAQAENLTAVKVFPTDLLGGPKWINTLKALFPGLKFCVSGGVTLDNMQEYFAINSVVAVGATWLAPAELIEQKAWDCITELTRDTLARYREIPR